MELIFTYLSFNSFNTDLVRSTLSCTSATTMSLVCSFVDSLHRCQHVMHEAGILDKRSVLAVLYKFLAFCR